MKRYLWVLLLLLGLGVVYSGNHNAYLLPEDRGTAGALAALHKLPVYARVLHITAHPDDESSGTLTWLSRKFHARTALFCLTRGEGGQNILGNEKYDALGLVRTGELLEACRYYGVELYFGSNLDFGFSKTAEETFSKWGHDAALQELVRFIRRWRPTIILSRFQGDSGDGHGHHQAAGILSKEAFRASGDPARFPEQIKNSMPSWQAKKLFVSYRPWDDSSSEGEKGRIVRIPVGNYDAVLGRSYREIAAEGYSKHRTQGSGNAYTPPGQAFESFKLADSVLENQPDSDSCFDSIDTSLTAIWELAGNEKQTVSFLKADLESLQKAANEALGMFQDSAPEKSAAAAARGVRLLEESIKKIETSSLSEPAKEILGDALIEKLQDFKEAVNALLGIRLLVITDDATAIPGEKEPITCTFYNQGSEKVLIQSIDLSAPGRKGKFIVSGERLEGKELRGGSSASAKVSFDILPDAAPTEPFWHLEKASDARYKLLTTPNEFAPFSPPEISAEALYVYNGAKISVDAAAMAQTADPIRGVDFVDFQIVPALSIKLNPQFEISPVDSGPRTHEFQIAVLNNRKTQVQGTLKLRSGSGWKAQSDELTFDLSRKGEIFAAKLSLQMPPGTKAGSYSVEAAATVGNQSFLRGYDVISYPENWTRYLYKSAEAGIERFDIKVTPGLSLGYIPGAGDDVPAALERLGLKPQILSAEDVAFGDLSRYSAIITGIRAYNVNEDLRTHNQRLLDYVADGGTLIVQYVRPMGGPRASGFVYAPYPMSGGNSDRITVEDSPVRILDPAHPIFNRPNKITLEDFGGWVQERGLYFMNTWDKHYSALLSGSDPGDAPQDGGMLYARYGKGHYIYTGYAWFRQLPAGNPGAYRIFANMISLGKN